MTQEGDDNQKSRIMQYFKQVNLSQEQIANFVGVSRVTISDWQNGKSVPNLDPNRMNRLCIALKCTIQELIDLFQPEESAPSFQLHQELDAIAAQRKKRGRPFKEKKT